MEKNCVASFYIKLTNNATAIPLSECELCDIIKIFRHFPRSKATEVLFRFQYGTNKEKLTALKWFTPKQNELSQTSYLEFVPISKIKNFTDKEFELLAKELQIQYQQCDTTFLSIDSIRGIPVECKKELDILQKKLADSPLLFFLAVKSCVKAKKNPAASQWILELFSNNTLSHCEGLKNLGFNFNCRLLLKPFSLEIGNLLLVMHQVYAQNQKLLANQDTLALPLVSLLEGMIEKNTENNLIGYHHFSDKIEMFETEVVNFLKRSSGVCQDSPNFNFFVAYSQQLETLGSAIIQVLCAEADHRKVFSNNTDGILYAVTTNFSIVQHMRTVENSLYDARNAYNSAYKNFQVFCLRNNI